MSKKSFLRAVFAGALLAMSSAAANASTVFGFYSLNGGPITALSDSTPGDSIFTFSGPLLGSNFTFASISALGQPDAGPSLLSASALGSHSGVSTDTLKLYFLATDLSPGGNLTFMSQFTSNARGGNLSVFESTYLGLPTAPGTGLGSAAYPPLLGLNSSVFSVLGVPAGFSLTAEIDITATGAQASNSTVEVSAVPGPVLGAGLPGLIMACGGLLALARRRRSVAV